MYVNSNNEYKNVSFQESLMQYLTNNWDVYISPSIVVVISVHLRFPHCKINYKNRCKSLPSVFNDTEIRKDNILYVDVYT